MSRILDEIFNYSCVVFVCVCAQCIHQSLWFCACVTVYESLCALPLRVAANRILAQGFLPITTWQREQMGFSEECSQLRVLCFSPATSSPTSPPLEPLHPPQPAVHGFCNFIKAPDHSFIVKSTRSLENQGFLKCKVSSPSNTLPQ